MSKTCILKMLSVTKKEKFIQFLHYTKSLKVCFFHIKKEYYGNSLLRIIKKFIKNVKEKVIENYSPE